MVTFSFVVYSVTEAKQYTGLGRAEPGLEPGRWIFQPGHGAPWCSAATEDGVSQVSQACRKISVTGRVCGTG